MAMLAEPRRKKRYHLTPKGKPLFEDNDRFGTKMLEKMGWSKGKGLGKSEDGTQDFVRVKYKADERGLGFEVRDDQWTEHDKNFNGLLENLNGGGAATTDACPDDCEMITPTVGLGFATKSTNKKKLKDKISGQSLEENSKKSKARVHYKKFTKGKDMSQYSEKDLANIFGKKAAPEEENIYSQFQAFNAGGSESEGKEESAKEEKECVEKDPAKAGPPIINTGVSVNDYFKAKMDAMKKKLGSASSNPFDSNVRIVNNVQVFVPSAKRKRSTDGEASEEEVPQKKKKSKTTEVEESVTVKQTEESGEIAEENVSRKKKKSKKQSIEVEEPSSLTKTAESSENVTEVEVPKKKKKDSKKNQESEVQVNGESNQNNHNSHSEELNSSKKKNKKKSKKVEEEIVKNQEPLEIACITAEDEIPKKKKKKDKKKTADDTVSNETDNTSSVLEESRTQNIVQVEEEEQQENVKLPNKSKKKKNKNKSSNPTTTAEVSSHLQKENLTSLTNENNNLLVDTYTISTFCAEKFRNIELHQFQGSNLSDLSGYGLSTNLELDIQNIANDAERIIRLWSGTLDKYTHSTSKQKLYSSYMNKVKQARNSKKKIPALKIKSLKRQQVFQCV